MCSPAKNREPLKMLARDAAEQKVIPQGGKSPTRALRRPVRVQDAWSHVPDRWVPIKEISQSIQAARQNLDVGIDQGDIASLAFADPHVVTSGETEIFWALDEFYPGIPSFDHFDSAVARSVVDHNHFHVAARRRGY